LLWRDGLSIDKGTNVIFADEIADLVFVDGDNGLLIGVNQRKIELIHLTYLLFYGHA
jgi:hypothetical protein